MADATKKPHVGRDASRQVPFHEGGGGLLPASEFALLVDFLPVGVLLVDGVGRDLHRSRLLDQWLASSPFGVRLREETGALINCARRDRTVDVPHRRDVQLSGYHFQCVATRLREEQSLGSGTIAVTIALMSSPYAMVERASDAFGLTAREAEVALLLANGEATAGIADALQITAATARHHTERVFMKLGVKRRAQVRPALQKARVSAES